MDTNTINCVSFKDKGRNGLANLGNTCYINTTVQCLSHCMRFLTFVLSQDKKESGLLFELRELLKDMWVNGHSLLPKRFVRSMHDSMKNLLNVYEQNDLPEFTMLLVDKLCEDIGIPIPSDHLSEIDAMLSNRDVGGVQRLTLMMDRHWVMQNAKDNSPLKDIFYGQQIMQILCGTCGHISHNYETMFMLPLALPDTSAHSTVLSLDDIIRDNMKPECMPDWACEKCKISKNCTKSTKIWKLPDVLVLSIKRFGPNMRKLHNCIHLPHTIDMTNYSIVDTDATYSLKSVACHMGGVNSGHYYALCHHPDGHWYHIDDLNIQKIPADKDPLSNLSLSKDFYVLFYERLT